MHICHGQIAGSVPEGATAANTAIAYEPVWAIGTGKTPTADEIAAMHAHIRQCLTERLGDGATGMRILYGGSVKPSNAAEILSLPEVGRRAGGRRQPESRGFSGDYRAPSKRALTRFFDPSLIRATPFCGHKTEGGYG